METTLTRGNVSLALIFNRPCLAVSFPPGSRCYNPQTSLSLPLSTLAIPLSSCLESRVPLTGLPAQRLMWVYWIHHLVTTVKISLLWFILAGRKKSFTFLEMQIRDDTCPIHFPDSNSSCHSHRWKRDFNHTHACIGGKMRCWREQKGREEKE